jgi:hypothetical protein
LTRQAALLFIALFLVYNLNLRQVSSHDTYASRFVAISIVRDGDLVLDEFVPETIKEQAGVDFVSAYFHYARGHFYDSHPPIGPLLALPVYALPTWIGIPDRDELAANLLSKLAASIMAALSAVAVFAASKRLLSTTKESVALDDRQVARETRVALLAALAYGLGTSVWSTAGLAIWTHTPAVLGYAVALWALTAARPGVAGLAAAAAAIARPATAPAVALLGMYLAHRAIVRGQRQQHWNDLARFAVSAAVVGLAGVLYNYWLFGNAVGGAPFRTEYWVDELGSAGMFSGSLLAGTAGLSVSPSRGILIFSPIVLIAFAGAIRVWRSAAASDALLLARYSSLAALAIFLTYSKFIVWWGGHGYGPRYLTDAMPFLGLLFAARFAALTEVKKRAPLLRAAAGTVLIYSVLVQAIGALCWPSAWTLNDNPPYRYRLWDWEESQIEMCIRSGPRLDPAAQRLFERIGFLKRAQ